MVRQAHHERNQQLAVRPEPVEGLVQRFLNGAYGRPGIREQKPTPDAKTPPRRWRLDGAPSNQCRVFTGLAALGGVMNDPTGTTTCFGFLGFLASLFPRNWPFAMVILLAVASGVSGRFKPGEHGTD